MLPGFCGGHRPSCSTGHCHQSVEAIQKQAAELIHNSGTVFITITCHSWRSGLWHDAWQRNIRSVLRKFPARKPSKAHQAGPLCDRSGTNSLPSTDVLHGAPSLPFTPRFQEYPAQAFRRTAGGVEYSIPYAYRARTAIHQKLRHGNSRTTRTADVQAALRAGRNRRHHHRADQAKAVRSCAGIFPCRNCSVICNRHGIMLIVRPRCNRAWDAPESGVLRTAGIEPDILCTAKGIASGMPLSASIAKESVMRWKPGSHGSTMAAPGVHRFGIGHDGPDRADIWRTPARWAANFGRINDGRPLHLAMCAAKGTDDRY